MNVSESFAACEWLLKKHAGLWLKIDDNKPDKIRAIIAPYVPEIKVKNIERMKRMRANGLTIEQISRSCRVSWRTAWKYSQKKHGTLNQKETQI